MHELLFKNIKDRGIFLTGEEEACLRDMFQYRRYRRNQYILQEGDVARHETFVLKGLTRTYEVSEGGQEHVLFFGPEDWWVGDLYSFLTETPSRQNIDCLEDTEVLQISKANLELLYDRVPGYNKYMRLLVQSSFIASTQRISATLTKTAQERYHDFLLRYPHIGQRVPNHQIASFLGITPQSLSRIRRQSATR